MFKYSYNFRAAAMMIASLILVISCQLNVLEFSQSSYSIEQGELLSLELGNLGSYSSDDLVWISSNPHIAVVDDLGAIKALQSGTVTITVSVRDKKWRQSCEVVVVEQVGIDLENLISVPYEVVTLAAGETWQLNPVYNGELEGQFEFRSLNKSVIIVSASGLITAVRPGSAEVIFWYTNEKSVSLEVLVSPKMISVFGGNRIIGDKEISNNSKQVFITGLFMSQYEVTQLEYETLMGYNPSSKSGNIGPFYPVNQLTWFESLEFCNSLSLKEGLTPCYSGEGDAVVCDFDADGYRLPTESEWEYSSRGGINGGESLYSGSDNANQVACYAKNRTIGGASVVGSYDPNELNLSDMSGNIAEWCWDRYKEKFDTKVADSTGSSSGDRRVIRGGSFESDEDSLHVAFRDSMEPVYKDLTVGFRVVRRDLLAMKAHSSNYNTKVNSNSREFHFYNLNSDASVIYTLDGSDPSGSEGISAVDNKFIIEKTSLVRVLLSSGELRPFCLKLNYEFAVGNISTTPSSGLFVNAQEVEIQCATEDIIMRYTIDESIPDSTHGILVSNLDTITLSKSCILKLFAFKEGYETTYTEYDFDIKVGGVKLVADGTSFPFNLSLQPETEDVHMRYRVDGTLPTEISGTEIFLGDLLSVTSETLLNLIVYKDNFDSCSFQYLIDANFIGVAVEGGTYSREISSVTYDISVSSFFTGLYEVMQSEYEAVIGDNPSNIYYGISSDLPVNSVSWYDAVEFANQLSINSGLTPCYTIDLPSVSIDIDASGYRLLTEAEWEFAARGGTRSRGYTYSGSDKSTDVGYTGGKQNSSQPVAQLFSNELGIYDMTGNLREWCFDYYSSYPTASQIDPVGHLYGPNRVRRGGSWQDWSSQATVNYRNYSYPTSISRVIGFRIARRFTP